MKKPYFSVYQAPATLAASSLSPGWTRCVMSTVSWTRRSRYEVHPGERTSSETGVPFTRGSAAPRAVQNNSTRATSTPRVNLVRASNGCASRAGVASPIGSATHSPSARNPAATVRGALHAVRSPEVEVTRTDTSRRSPAASGANGHATRTLSAPSRTTVSRPSVSSASRWIQPSAVSPTTHDRRGVAVATTAESSLSSARRRAVGALMRRGPPRSRTTPRSRRRSRRRRSRVR